MNTNDNDENASGLLLDKQEISQADLENTSGGFLGAIGRVASRFVARQIIKEGFKETINRVVHSTHDNNQ